MCPCEFDHRATGAAWRLRGATYEAFLTYDFMKQSGICPASENIGTQHAHFTTGIDNFGIRCQKKNKVTFGEYIPSVTKQNGDCSNYSSIFHLRSLLTQIPRESVAGSESVIKWAHSVCCMFHTYLITGHFSVFLIYEISCKISFLRNTVWEIPCWSRLVILQVMRKEFQRGQHDFLRVL